MITNTEKHPSPGSREPGTTKPTLAAAAGAFLRNPLNKGKAAPSEVEISVKAYQIWLSQGQEQGHDQEHWFLAQQELSRS